MDDEPSLNETIRQNTRKYCRKKGSIDFEFKNVIHIFVELFHMSRKNISPSSKILWELKFCVCDYGTRAGDNLNCSYGCSSSVLVIQ